MKGADHLNIKLHFVIKIHVEGEWFEEHDDRVLINVLASELTEY